ncbi:uncharacterized protein BXZ73DRAFT_76561 [Epithele typhae]|uniref:uncharacterized protein n=1 Tax=Epithele typhae TaxID=378194 RepID=UPI00200883D7|nr:uncharacterized protein BXZ73DRAFT_76561 [Epithele typhae]KAH9936732.1 hypothetical protein BXZ73DRAFT_76561 [Epithele typhae]
MFYNPINPTQASFSMQDSSAAVVLPGRTMWLMLDIASLPADRLSELAFFFGGVTDDRLIFGAASRRRPKNKPAPSPSSTSMTPPLRGTSAPAQHHLRPDGAHRDQSYPGVKGETYDELGGVSIGFIAHALRPQANQLVRSEVSGWCIARSRRQPRALDLFEANVPVLIED